MHIRTRSRHELDQASALCMASFTQSVAPLLSAKGITTFGDVASVTAFAERMQGDNLMLVCEVEGRLAGLVELKQGRHVAMLFVCPARQCQGIGRRLIKAALGHARSQTVTVNASLPPVAAYQRYGFSQAGEVGEHAGLIYQPMQKVLSM
ncbi:acetyltransferase family protein [Pseudomonas putida S610]|uniref:GNAT family N-acetyltransferase n=1 Tax=Pseudomonas putida group TaxID=136845 RepID=UPI0003C58D13|nr:GNAT family N-acetyltransferase [Pseudomonas putida]EST13968.1 acetyltransferase family protein [Pseudomonas putida S610]